MCEDILCHVMTRLQSQSTSPGSSNFGTLYYALLEVPQIHLLNVYQRTWKIISRKNHRYKTITTAFRIFRRKIISTF